MFLSQPHLPGNSRDNCRFNPCCRFHRTMHAPPPFSTLLLSLTLYYTYTYTHRVYTAPITIVQGYLENSLAWKTARRDSLCSFARPIGFGLIMRIRADLATTLDWKNVALIYPIERGELRQIRSSDCGVAALTRPPCNHRGSRNRSNSYYAFGDLRRLTILWLDRG